MSKMTLPEKKGFKIIKVGDVLELDSSAYNDIENTTNIPFFDAYNNPSGDLLYNIVSAETCIRDKKWYEQTKILKSSGLISAGTPFLFDASRGPIAIPDFYSFWKIKDDVVLPQYLIFQLGQHYSQDQYFTDDVKDYKPGHEFDDTLIYIPQGDVEFSLYEQQRIFNEYRAKELAKMSAALNMGVGVNGTLASGALLQNGKYIIDEFISGGGFGKVYKAKVTKSHNGVAIKELFVKNYCSRLPYNSKVMVPELAQQSFSRQIRKFQCEFAILSKLGKITKYVPKVIGEPFAENNTIYYAMDYVSGGTLWSNCQSNSLTNKQVVNIICQAGIVLHHAHDLDYLHLDVSPLNIMVDEYDNGILIDFGSNKHYNDADGRISSVGLVAKTKPFAAPEILQQVVGQYFMQSDVYSLAASLYAALTGDIPFYHSNNNDKEFMEHICQKMKESCVPDELSEVILKSLSCDVESRHKTILEFLQSLPQDMIEPEIQKEINSLKPVSGFNVDNHIVTNSDMQNSDFMPDYTSEEVSD